MTMTINDAINTIKNLPDREYIEQVLEFLCDYIGDPNRTHPEVVLANNCLHSANTKLAGYTE